MKLLNIFQKRMFIYIIAFFLTIAMTLIYYILNHRLDSFSPDQNIAAYYQTGGTHRVASYVAMSLFRSVYPSVPLYIHYDILINDKGINNMQFYPTLTTTAKNLSDLSASSGMHFTSVSAAEAYIKRLQAAAALNPHGWVLLLEDDVWCWQTVNHADLVFDISGTCWAKYRSEYSKAILQMAPSHQAFLNATCYGGYGGHFVNSSRLLGLQMNLVQRLIKLLLESHSPIASDELLSAVILQEGGSIGYYAGYYEYTKGHSALKTLHQMKWLYPLF
jgi:hypothetical protein